jgi:hypothetical protein
MAVAEIAQESQILRQPIAVPRQELAAVQHPVHCPYYLVGLTRLISTFIPSPPEVYPMRSFPSLLHPPLLASGAPAPCVTNPKPSNLEIECPQTSSRPQV